MIGADRAPGSCLFSPEISMMITVQHGARFGAFLHSWTSEDVLESSAAGG